MDKKTEENDIRVLLRFSGVQKDRMLELADILGVNGPAEACRYLISRGLEASVVQLSALRMLRRLETQYSPQEMLPFFEQMGIKP